MSRPGRALAALDRALDPLLQRMGEDDAAVSASRVRALRRAALLTFAADFLLWSHARPGEPAWLRVGLPATLLGALLLDLRVRQARAACLVAFAALGFYAIWAFPGTGNHPALYLGVAALLAGFDPDDARERASLLSGARWLTVIVLFWTGLQKALAGTYFHAQFLSWAVAALPRFRVVFAPLIPADELARLVALGGSALGSGPYRVDAPLLVIASNLAWLGELGFALLLIPRATRVWAALGAIGLLAAIEVAAHELFFGGFFASLLLLFLPARVAPRTLPWLAAFYALALAVGWLLGEHIVIT